MQRVTDLVDGAVFGLQERGATGHWIRLGAERVGLEKEADFVARV